MNEQGIKLEPLAQRIINNTVDSWAKQLPTGEEFSKVQEINQMRGRGITPENELEAKAYIYANSDERERDQISSSIASAATEKAAEIRTKQAEVKREKEMEKENPLYDDYNQGRSM